MEKTTSHWCKISEMETSCSRWDELLEGTVCITKDAARVRKVEQSSVELLFIDSNQPTASHPPIDVKFQQRWPKSSPIHDFRFSGARKSLVPTQIPWISSVKA
ncbi:uncharacterized protein LOC113674847 [Pocillopora damicornis]|uniref:uncharacterized protein LOC113674847 n=1 Tax=Pocillopora damicornis TaxID=46731 RepID=UPI000F54E2FF|nr:uncharacterized protein LOC113674847 [Pocillopora damicornis]